MKAKLGNMEVEGSPEEVATILRLLSRDKRESLKEKKPLIREQRFRQSSHHKRGKRQKCHYCKEGFLGTRRAKFCSSACRSRDYYYNILKRGKIVFKNNL